ncbi:MAG: N-acetylmuramoyl-L-alanine amidase [Myxococcota bacterium]
MRWFSLTVVAALGASCAAEPYAPFELDTPEAPWSDPDAEPNEASDSESLDSPRAWFEEAEARFDVPADLLIALSASATGHQMVEGEVEFEGQIPTFGVMALPDEWADEAAALADVDPEDALLDRSANILAAAALLSEWADEQGIDRQNINAWAPVIARYSGIEALEGQANMVHEQVYEALASGVDMEGLAVEPRKVFPDFPTEADDLRAAGGDRSYAVWRPSPNNSARPSGASGTPAMVIIHTCEGSYSGCWSWLKNTRSGASAHYVVNSTGSEVTQLVRESRKAWHISATYQCSRNSSTDCWRNGASSNNFTVGIEHAGYGSQKSWNSGLLDQSAQLTCDITKTHSIPRDAYHIVGHGQLQPYNRTDPGKNWPWTNYLADVRSKCGSGGSGGGTGGGGTGGGTGTPSGTRVIDSNNANNTTADQYIKVSGNWKASANVSGYYGSGYWWRSTGSSSDSANYYFRNSAKTCYSVQAWWPASTDRSKKAPFVMLDASSKVLDTVYVDQSSKHAQWVKLGSYNFPTGWNRVALSRWTDPGKVVVADALRLVPATDCTGTTAPKVDIIVDNNNANNGTTAKTEASSAWSTSSSTKGYQGTDYAYAATVAKSDPFKYWFYLDQETKVNIDARWTAGTNRSSTAPFMIRNSSDSLVDKVTKDQTKNGNTWVSLGTWTLPAGWNRVDLSRWAPTGKVVVADAVRIKTAE